MFLFFTIKTVGALFPSAAVQVRMPRLNNAFVIPMILHAVVLEAFFLGVKCISFVLSYGLKVL